MRHREVFPKLAERIKPPDFSTRFLPSLFLTVTGFTKSASRVIEDMHLDMGRMQPAPLKELPDFLISGYDADFLETETTKALLLQKLANQCRVALILGEGDVADPFYEQLLQKFPEHYDVRVLTTTISSLIHTKIGSFVYRCDARGDTPHFPERKQGIPYRVDLTRCKEGSFNIPEGEGLYHLLEAHRVAKKYVPLLDGAHFAK